MKKKFDICLMNPPYDNGLCDTFLYNVLDICNQIITVQPTAFVMGKKQTKKIIEKIKDHYVNIEKLNNGNAIFNVGLLMGEIGIVTINLQKDKKIIYNEKEIESIINIKHYYDDELIIDFEKIVKPLYTINNADQHIIKGADVMSETDKKYYRNKFIIRISLFVRGYKLLAADSKIGQFKDLENLTTNKASVKGETAYLRSFFAFDTENEMKNCYNYLQTDFVTACLYLIKTTMHTDRGELKCIPWFDFSDSHFSKSPREIDNWLFKKYNISDEIRKHIEEILPDYYGIRK